VNVADTVDVLFNQDAAESEAGGSTEVIGGQLAETVVDATDDVDALLDGLLGTGTVVSDLVDDGVTDLFNGTVGNTLDSEAGVGDATAGNDGGTSGGNPLDGLTGLLGGDALAPVTDLLGGDLLGGDLLGGDALAPVTDLLGGDLLGGDLLGGDALAPVTDLLDGDQLGGLTDLLGGDITQPLSGLTGLLGDDQLGGLTGNFGA
jgi:hypothetical protein